jgi:ribose transport system permease protein
MSTAGRGGSAAETGAPPALADPAPGADPEQARAEGEGRLARLFSRGAPQTLIIFGVLVAMCVVLSVLSPDFLRSANLLNVARQVSLIIIVGCGMTFLLTSAGIDISVGSVVALGGVVFAGLAAGGTALWLAGLAAIAIGGLVGMVHGTLIVKGGIVPFIATLGTMYALRGAAYIYTNQVSGGTTIVNGLPDNYTTIGQGYVAGIPIPVIIALVVAVGCHLLFTRTLLGRHTRAIGGNPDAAWLSGLRVSRNLFAIYILTGALAGLSGVMLSSRLASGQPSAASGFEFDVIIAAIIGGTSLFGGRGTIIGTVIGAFIIGVLGNGLNLLDVDTFWQQVVKGSVLILAVLADGKLRGGSLRAALRRIGVVRRGPEAVA